MVDEGHIDWEEKELKEIFRSILMTTCDIGAITKPWDVSRKVDNMHVYPLNWERSGSVVECLIRDRRAAVRASPASLRCCP